MSIRKTTFVLLVGSFVGASLITSAFAQGNTPSPKASSPPAGQPSDAEMMAQMMKLAQPGEQHKLLADLDGTWTYTVKLWMVPGAPPDESGRGTAVRASMMGGRYFTMNVSGKMQMPGADGKMSDVDYQGMSIDAYDNVKQKYVSAWIDNMGTSILLSEGAYDPATKSFTYHLDEEMVPGKITKAREVLKVLDKDHLRMEWYEIQAGKDVETMEINYSRKG